MIEQVLEQMEKADHAVYGLRVADGMELDQTLPSSRVWDDGFPTDEALDGTSVIEIRAADSAAIVRALKACAQYQGSHIAMVGGHAWTRGQDAGELIIRDAEVLALWAKE